MDHMSMPFTLRGVSGQIHVSLVVNDDPLRYGCDLLDPDLSPDAAQGYPVCRAEIEHDADGYAAAMGWVQLVRSTDAAPEFEMDPLALFREVATPFAFFGIKPTMFDAPFRDEKYDLTWRAETFLCAIPDGVMSQHAQPLAGYGWGFDVLDRGIALVAPTVLDLSAWDQHLSVLRSLYPTWVFDDVAGG